MEGVVAMFKPVAETLQAQLDNPKNKVIKLHGTITEPVIRHANDRKMYLYDILDIKKETSNPFKSQDFTW